MPGKDRVTVVPWPSSEAMRTEPPDCSAKPLTMDRPSPVPRPSALVVKKGSVVRLLQDRLRLVPARDVELAGEEIEHLARRTEDGADEQCIPEAAAVPAVIENVLVYLLAARDAVATMRHGRGIGVWPLEEPTIPARDLELLVAGQHLEGMVAETDVHMPGEHDGLALASHVRSRWPTVPVIFTTGRPDALRRLEKLDARQVLVRMPYVPNDIIACIQQLGAMPAGLSNDAGGA